LVQLPLGVVVVVVLEDAGIVVLAGAIVVPGSVVDTGGATVVTVVRPCLGTVVTVVPSAMMN
jgi:hypothetical protein